VAANEEFYKIVVEVEVDMDGYFAAEPGASTTSSPSGAATTTGAAISSASSVSTART
jgi:hypothetical protein